MKARERISRIGKVFALFLSLGGFYGAVSAFCVVPNPIALVLGFQYGVMVGMFCSPLGIVLLQRKPMDKTALVLTVYTLPVCIVAQFFFRMSLDIFIGLPVCVFILAIFVCIAIPDLPFDLAPEHCRKCSYSLIGNVSGICPECGEPIPREQRAWLAKTEEDERDTFRSDADIP